MRLWTRGESGRIGSTSTTTQIQYQPDPLPPPPNLVATGVRGGATITWGRVVHSALIGYEFAYQAGESCPARPADVPAGQRAGFSAAQAEGGLRLTAQPGRYCVGVWSRDYLNRLSASASTTVVEVPPNS